MCLPKGLVSFVAKICTIFIVGFSMFCFYAYVEKGMFTLLNQTIPLITVLFIFLTTGVCSCIGLNKRSMMAGFCTVIFASLTFIIAIWVNQFSIEFFDLSKGCPELIKMNPLYAQFIDQNLDNYFNESSTLLCSQKCPCKWEDKTEELKKNPSKYIVDKKNGARSVLECPQYLDDIQFEMEKQQYLQMMIHLEKFGCSGYCKKNDIFSISNINLGQPKQNCFVISRLLQKKSVDTILIGLFILSWATLFLIFSTCCLFYRFNKESTEKDEMMETVNKMRNELIGAKKGTAPENEEDDGDENDNADVSENKQKQEEVEIEKKSKKNKKDD